MNRRLPSSRRLLLQAAALAFALVAAFPASPAGAADQPSAPPAGQGAVGILAPSPQAQCTPGRAACPIRIVFRRGAYSAQASSTLTGIRSEKWFSVRARAGQNMIIVVIGRGPTRGTVVFPNGQQSGQPGGLIFNGSLPVSGPYRIRVTESTMAEAWSGPVTVVAVIY
jgi:hypothetical protein